MPREERGTNKLGAGTHNTSVEKLAVICIYVTYYNSKLIPDPAIPDLRWKR